MAEKGRPSASSGNAYHDIRVAHCLIDLLEDPSLASVAVETADAIDDLVIRRSDGAARYEQVKERAPGTSWTATQLINQDIVGQFIRQFETDPNGTFVLFTASDASKFREASERARNALENHSNDEQDRDAALTEWRQRLQSLTRFVDQLLSRLAKTNPRATLIWKDLQSILACVTVLDNSGTADQLRTRGAKRLRPLADDPIRAFQTLECLARNAAISRRVLTRGIVETALSRDGSGLRPTALPLSIDAPAYAKKIEQDSNAVDVAKLPRLEPSFLSSPETQHQLHAVQGRLLLVGSHGSGKSRVAAELAVKSLHDGFRCLHVRLARWATTLRNLLIAELSVAAARRASFGDFTNQFGHAGVLILDGLDEVPYPDRLRAEREIIEFADTHPHLDILVTCRPGSGHILSQQWNTIQLKPLTRDQIDSTLGSHGHAWMLAAPVLQLATNPLMLGLLVQQLANDVRPSGEAKLLDTYVSEIVERQSSRFPAIDPVSAQRLAETVAYEWLTSGRISLDQSQMKSLAASVALTLREQALIQLDARKVEMWLEEAGFSIKIDGGFVPIHRAVLDHLAARSMEHRNPDECANRPELREAVARYLSAQTQVGGEMLSFLSAFGTDLEVLARGRALSPSEIDWPYGPQRFALDYLSELRRLGKGPLADVGVVNRPIQIDVDADISWIAEGDSPTDHDVVHIVPAAPRPHLVDSTGAGPIPILAFSASGHHGAAIDIKVPHYAAFARVKYEVEHLVRQRALKNEGPDIVYERLCSLAKKFFEIVNMVEGIRLIDVVNGKVRGCTALTLQTQFANTVASIANVDERNLEIGNKCVIFAASSREPIIVESAHKLSDNFGARPIVHGGELVQLVDQAVNFGIAELPLHPLGLMPGSGSDPVLSLSDDQFRLRGAALQLFVERHELGSMRGFRYLIENNFAGLKLLLKQYSSMPWKVEVAIEEKENREAFGPHIQSVKHFHWAVDEVVQVSEVSKENARWWASSGLSAYCGVLNAAYELVEQDLSELMSGSDPLGSVVL